MASILRMPGISADSDEATLLEWSVVSGAEIHTGDVLATVETEKANVDIESDQDAVLWRTLAEPGTLVAVGSPIAVLIEVGEDVGDEAAVLSALGISGSAPSSSPTPPASSTPATAETSAEAAPQSSPGDPGINVLGTVSVGQMEPDAEAEPVSDAPASEPTEADGGPVGVDPSTGERRFASPIARRIAREGGVAIETLEGTGPLGRIIRADVERAVAAGAAAPRAAAPAPQTPPAAPAAASAPKPARVPDGTYTDIPHTGMRRAVASRLTQSKREAPHFYVSATCRVDDLLALRETINGVSTVRVSINDFFVKAVAKTLAEFPEMNVNWMDDAVRRFDSVDISVAINTERGLVTPVLRSADTLTLTQISAQIREYAGRAKEGRLKQHELEGGAMTVTNLGMFGVESFSAIINPPQVAILAVGAVTKQAIVDESGQLGVGSTVTVTISADHRPVDGVLVATWLQRFTSLIEAPISILA